MKAPKLSVFVLASHRSGSSLLCQLLEKTNACGKPEEYFMHWQGSSYQNWDISNYDKYLRRVVTETQTENKVFSAKLMTGWDGIYGIIKRLHPDYKGAIPEKMPELGTYFPNLKCIFLTRRNKIAQTVSWLKAAQSNVYHSTDSLSSDVEFRYNSEALNNLMTSIIMEEAAHQEFLDTMGIVPLNIVYEDYIQDMPNTIEQIMNFLEITESYSVSEPSLRKIADALSDEWVERYRQDAQANTADEHKRW